MINLGSGRLDDLIVGPDHFVTIYGSSWDPLNGWRHSEVVYPWRWYKPEPVVLGPRDAPGWPFVHVV